MINPILVIAASAVILSALVISLLNKPRWPVVTSAVLIVLIFFLVTTYLIDTAISDYGIAKSMNDFVCFSVVNKIPTYDDLSISFKTFMYIDMSLFVMAILSMFIESMYILRKNSDV